MNFDEKKAMTRLLNLVEQLQQNVSDPEKLKDILGRTSSIRSCELARASIDGSDAVEQSATSQMENLRTLAESLYRDLEDATGTDFDQSPDCFDQELEEYSQALFGVSRDQVPAHVKEVPGTAVQPRPRQ